ncbi:DUF4270 domain-containing protein [Flavobacterium glaciei]|uniref:Uncharacterized protein DUF4270 n=1 Tax=Flavobacterium glaciei TaxID=386300 RepID=A0A562PXP9_9FLAO|nr:DUF4270 domain-containing protein [Flavobacterium glaciei]RDI56627.1 uncharacterized protein DUF4270 [Flavobacterium glaciei]TWI49197.1 uncharacterized protein DUF4270 [Flavobacterium glaciei]
MYNNSFFKKILLVTSVVFLFSCDKDYNEIGGDLIGENNFDLKKETYDVLAYNQKTGPIQSNDLAINPLGIYNNPNFGETTANFGTQLTLSETMTTIGTRPHIESVVLTIPYYFDASKTVKKTDGSNVYVLDSIYGPDKAEMKLSVYESGYYMRDADPIGGFVQPQRYFTNQNAEFDNIKKPNRLNDDTNLAQNDKFFFDPSEHVVTTTDSITKAVTTTRTPPGMQLNLNKGFFKTKIIDAVASGKLATNDVFKEYFRGLYFKMEKSGSSAGNLAMLNFKDGKITIKYNEDLSTTTSGVTTVTRVKKTIVLNMTGNSVSLLDTDFTGSGLAYNALPNTGNTTEGDEKLYLKGGEGSVAVLSLFNAPGELDAIRKSGWLINDASLVFHIDAAAMANSFVPQRIYLYDFNNNRPIADYYLESENNTNPKKSKLIFGGNLNTDAVTKKGTTYKIRITNQIRNLVKHADSTNVKLGLVVTEDINIDAYHRVRTPNAFITGAPKASVMNPLGTILHGGNSTVPNDKRLKLEIYYTKPN